MFFTIGFKHVMIYRWLSKVGYYLRYCFCCKSTMFIFLKTGVFASTKLNKDMKKVTKINIK